MSRDSDRWMNDAGGGGYSSSSSHKKKKESKSKFRKKQKMQKEIDLNEKNYGPAQEQKRTNEQNALAKTAKQQRLKSQMEGHDYAQKIMNEDTPGLTSPQRSAMQYEAERQIDRGHEVASRRLLGDQSQRGIVGRGGVAYAQQRDLAERAQEARGGVNRDLNKLNADLALKKKAAQFAIAQGETAAQGLEREEAADALAMSEKRKKDRAKVYAANHNFGRI